MEKVIRKSDAIRYDENPFLAIMCASVNIGKKQIIVGDASDVWRNELTGELKGKTVIHKYQEIEKDKFVKLFVNEVAFMHDLSRRGLKVLSYVIENLKPKKDEIYMHLPDVMKHCSYTQVNHVYTGIGELLGANILAVSSKPNIWYINPTFIFNGSRLTLIKEYVSKDADNMIEQLNVNGDDEY